MKAKWTREGSSYTTTAHGCKCSYTKIADGFFDGYIHHWATRSAVRVVAASSYEMRRALVEAAQEAQDDWEMTIEVCGL